MAANQKSISQSPDKKVQGHYVVLTPPNSNVPISCCQCYSGSSRVDGEPISSVPTKRPSGEINTDDPKRQKITFGVGTKHTSQNDSKTASAKGKKPGIQIKLSSNKQTVPIPPVKSRPTASIFNNDDDDEEPEEMPPEARMRMRNIGRDTPTSAGPNSFGKTKQGFCDSKKVFEKSLKAAIEKAGND